MAGWFHGRLMCAFVLSCSVVHPRCGCCLSLFESFTGKSTQAHDHKHPMQFYKEKATDAWHSQGRQRSHAVPCQLKLSNVAARDGRHELSMEGSVQQLRSFEQVCNADI